MSLKRMVDIDFWTDSKVIYFTPQEKYFFLYLLTNPHTRQLGIYEINVKQAAFEMGYDENVVKDLLDKFENTYQLIKRSGDEIAIKNFLRHSIIKGGKPVEDCLNKDISLLKDKNLLLFVYNSIKDTSVNISVRAVFDNVISEFHEKESNKEKDIPISNDNDNDSIVGVSSTNRPRIVKTQSESQTNESSTNRPRVANESSKAKKPKPFIPPTLEEVEQYIQEKNLGVDGKRFYDYFTVGNWVDGKGNHVRNWKQKILTWDSHREYNKPVPKKDEVPSGWGDELKEFLPD